MGTNYSFALLCGCGFVQQLVTVEIYSNKPSFQSWPHCTRMYDVLTPRGLHTSHPAVRQRAKEDGCHEGSQHWFLQAKPLALAVPGHLLSLVWFRQLDIHFKLSIITGCRLAIVVVDMVVGFILLVLTQDILAGHSGDDRQTSWWSLGNGRVAPVQ